MAGTSRLRYCQVSFAVKKPTWGVSCGEGGVAVLLAPPPVRGVMDGVPPVWPGAYRDVSGRIRMGAPEARKRIRLTKRIPFS